MASKPQTPGKTVNFRPPQTAPPAPNRTLQTASCKPRAANPSLELQTPGKTAKFSPPKTAPQLPNPSCPNHAPAPCRESQPRIVTSKQQAANREQRIPASNPRPQPKPQTVSPQRPNPSPQILNPKPLSGRNRKQQATSWRPNRKPQPQIANGKPQAPSPKPQISDRHGASPPTRKIPTSDLQLATSQPQAIDRKIPIPNHSSPTVYPTAPLPRPPAREVFHNAPSYISCRIPILSTSGCMLQKFFTCYPHGTIL